MAFKRKRTFSKTPRRTTYKRRRTLKRSLRRGLSSNVHMYKRWGTANTVECTGTETDQAIAFTLQNVSGYSELTALYDRYQISAVTVKFQLINNPELIYVPGTDPTTTINNPTFYPKLWYYRDYDDISTINLSAMREVGKAKFKVMKPNTVLSVRLKPAVLRQIYRSAITTAYEPCWPKSLDINAADTPHYGLKWILDSNGVTPWNNGKFFVRVDYVYTLKLLNSR